MKSKLKSGNLVVRLLLAHGEKVGIGVIIICAGMLVWSSLGRESLKPEQQPDKLVSAADRAIQQVNNFVWDSLPEEEKPVAKVPGQVMEPVNPSDFPPPKYSWNRSVTTVVGPRIDPVLLAPVDLEVEADAGLWAVGDRETARKKRFEMMKQAMEKNKKQAAERERANRKNKGNNQSGGNPLFGGGGEGGGAYGGMQNEGARGGNQKKDGAVVLRPRAGVKLTGVEEVKATSWVTVMARIPIKAQYQLYDDALQNSRGYRPQIDVPSYLGYVVQRAEVTHTGQGEWQKVATITEKKLLNRLKRWPATPMDVIDSKYSHPLLTHPLPPLLLRGWDENATHSQMLLPSAQLEQRNRETESEETPDETPAEEMDEFAVSSQKRRGPAANELGGERGAMRGGYGGGQMRGGYGGMMEGGGYGGMMEGGGYGGMMEGGGYGGMMEGGGYGGMMEGGGYGGMMEGGGYGGMMEGGGYGGMGEQMAGGGGRMGAANLGTFVFKNNVSYVLLRYFDDRVKPGHRYRYRFQLVLKDVNNVEERYLAAEVAARREKEKQSYRRTDWSEPSPVVGVPQLGRIYIAGAKAAKENNVNDEPSAKLLVHALSREHAAEIAMEDWFRRGSVVNMKSKANVIWADKYDPSLDVEFDFQTGITMLDFAGGQSLSRRDSELTAPARALLMDAAGNLRMVTELEHAEQVSEYELAVKSGKSSRGGYGGGMGGYGGMGEGYGGMGGGDY
ncbi:MAG: hypothetical protein ABGX16_11380 [Pirellulales bacterium]